MEVKLALSLLFLINWTGQVEGQDSRITKANIIRAQNYIHELSERFATVLNHDNSSDQRLANLLYCAQSLAIAKRNFDQFNSGNQQEDAKNELLVAGPQVDDTRCGQHLDQMLKLMQEMHQISNGNQSVRYQDRHLRMARLLDSFGHYESGYMSGRMYSFGSYDQCRNTQLELNSAGEEAQKLTRTRYCWAKLRLDEYSSQELQRNNQNDSHNYPLRVAICLPESCHSRSINTYRAQLETILFSQFRLPSPMYAQREPKLDSIFCIVDENSQVAIPTDGKILMALLAAWFGLLVFATLKRKRMSPSMQDDTTSRANALMQCLDVRLSWFEFTGDLEHRQQLSNNSRRVELDALNLIRILACALVVYGHVFVTLLVFTTDQVTIVNGLETSMFGTSVMVATVMVDSFFVISGLILTYLIMKRANTVSSKVSNGLQGKLYTQSSNNQTKQFVSSTLQIIKARYLRLIPLLALVYWFKRSVFTYLGSGPLWDFGFNRETLYGACQQESWLVSPLTPMSAFQPLTGQCLMQSWSVSNDLFFVIVFAPIILIMTRRPKLAGLMMVVLSIASNYLFIVALGQLNEADKFSLEELMVQGLGALFARMSHLYTYPTYRITSFVVGVASGFVLYHYERGEKIKDWPDWFRGPATGISLVNMVVQFLMLANGIFMKQHLDPYHRLVFPFSMTLGKLIWSVSNSVVFLRLMTDWNQSRWARLGAGRFWQSISKLGYAVFLLHFDCAVFQGMIATQANIYDHWTIFQMFMNIYLICTLLGLVIFVAIQNPLDKLVRRFIL